MRAYFDAESRVQQAFFFFFITSKYVLLRDPRANDRLQKRKNTLPAFLVLI